MTLLIREIRHTPLLRILIFVPVELVAAWIVSLPHIPPCLCLPFWQSFRSPLCSVMRPRQFLKRWARGLWGFTDGTWTV